MWLIMILSLACERNSFLMRCGFRYIAIESKLTGQRKARCTNLLGNGDGWDRGNDFQRASTMSSDGFISSPIEREREIYIGREEEQEVT